MMLQRGFVPPNATVYQNLLHRAALTSLLLQSPAGELPTGSRSSQHQWNEVGLAASRSIVFITGWSPSCYGCCCFVSDICVEVVLWD